MMMKELRTVNEWYDVLEQVERESIVRLKT